MKVLTSVAFALALTAVADIAHAQVMAKKTLTLEGAKQVIAAAVAEARQKNAPGGAIAIVDDGGNLMALERLDNTFAAAANISIGKARTAAIFKRPTAAFEDIIRSGRTPMIALNDFTPLQGGIPIISEGQVIGGIGVSGAATAQQDDEIAMAGATALTAQATGGAGMISASTVTYIESKKVAEAFAKGAVLVGNEETMMHASRNYMVHASRRDAPGVAEIHELDTDIIYVLDGTATFVTGGTAVDTKTTGPYEIRGTVIRGGETRKLSKGDIIIVPTGVAHWFKEVRGPFTYFVVKVR